MFAAQVVDFFPASGTLLELGAGLGQDSRFFAEYGMRVIATDIEPTLLEINERKRTADIHDRLEFKQMDMQQTFPFQNESFDIVYAHMSLHYFDSKVTAQIFAEIARVLKPQGWLAFLVNSTSDPEYGMGTPIEPDYWLTDDKPRRFFSEASAAAFAEPYFETKFLDNSGETYQDSRKGIHHLIRFVGQKKLGV